MTTIILLVSIAMENREDLKASCMQELQSDIELLCVTGVEDKLQLEVADTIYKLLHAGIKVWKLTGDKWKLLTV